MEDDPQRQKDFLKFWEHIEWKSQNETLILLKGHLLVEDLMREYCESKVENSSQLEKARLSFPQVLHLTRALQKYETSSWVWGAVAKLNGLRNSFAHNLTPKNYEAKRNEFIELIRTKKEVSSDNLFDKFPRDFERFGVAIFVVYAVLSTSLRFKPKGLFLDSLRIVDTPKAD